MEQNRNGFLSELFERRSQLLEFFFAAILLALGMEWLANYIPTFFNIEYKQCLILGLILTLIPLLYFFICALGKRECAREINGFFLYHKDQNKVLNIIRYDFGSNLFRFLKAAFVESSEMKQLWENKSLGFESLISKNDKSLMTKASGSRGIISEASEYYIIYSLSKHLEEYFKQSIFKHNKLTEFERENLPKALYQNRFMDLFTRDIKQRKCFVKHATDYVDKGGTVTSGSDEKAEYHRFHLFLPQGSKIKRFNDNNIEIDTPFFKMRISLCTSRNDSLLPEGFARYYMDIRDPEEIDVYQVLLNISVSFKLISIFTGGWHYYRWVDSFLDQLEQMMSDRQFFDTIGWNTAYTVLKCLHVSKDQD